MDLTSMLMLENSIRSNISEYHFSVSEMKYKYILLGYKFNHVMKKDVITTIILTGFVIDGIGWLINDYISESFGFPVIIVGVVLMTIGVLFSIRNSQ